MINRSVKYRIVLSTTVLKIYLSYLLVIISNNLLLCKFSTTYHICLHNIDKNNYWIQKQKKQKSSYYVLYQQNNEFNFPSSLTRQKFIKKVTMCATDILLVSNYETCLFPKEDLVCPFYNGKQFTYILAELMKHV